MSQEFPSDPEIRYDSEGFLEHVWPDSDTGELKPRHQEIRNGKVVGKEETITIIIRR